MPESKVATSAGCEPTCEEHRWQAYSEPCSGMAKRELGLRSGGLGARARAHRWLARATTTSCHPLLPDEVDAAACDQSAQPLVQEDGSTCTESTESKDSDGWPGARASTAALAHRQHLRADELMMLSFESLTTTLWNNEHSVSRARAREAWKILRRSSFSSGFCTWQAHAPVPQRVVGSTVGEGSGGHGFCKTPFTREPNVWVQITF